MEPGEEDALRERARARSTRRRARRRRASTAVAALDARRRRGRRSRCRRSPSARSPRSSGSHPSSRAAATSCATWRAAARGRAAISTASSRRSTPSPGALETVEARLQRIADLQRRFDASTLDELLARREAADGELEALADGHDPVEAAARRRRGGRPRSSRRSPTSSGGAERPGGTRFGAAVADELASLGMGEGEFLVELRGPRARADRSRRGGVPRSARTPGLPFAPVAETASGGELSRIALALAAVGGRRDARVRRDRRRHRRRDRARGRRRRSARLAERAQVLTITHLPQIASVADRHFRVEKVAGRSRRTRRIEELDDLLRREELERMLGGGSSSLPRRGLRLCEWPPVAPQSSFSRLPWTCGRSWRSRHHLADWWPNAGFVEPDRLGLGAGARWRVRSRESTWLRRAERRTRCSSTRPEPCRSTRIRARRAGIERRARPRRIRPRAHAGRARSLRATHVRGFTRSAPEGRARFVCTTSVQTAADS